MEKQIKEHNMVQLLVNLDSAKLGMLGTVVHVYLSKNAYEVEFTLPDGSVVCETVECHYLKLV
jgi:hypothetical protein